MSDPADYDDEMRAYRHERLRRAHNPTLARELMKESEIARLVATFDSAKGDEDEN